MVLDALPSCAAATKRTWDGLGVTLLDLMMLWLMM